MKQKMKRFFKKATLLLVAATMLVPTVGLYLKTLPDVQAKEAETQPIFRLDFDETSGNQTIDSVNRTELTISGNGSFVKGEIANALHFDGTTEIRVPEDSPAYGFNTWSNYTFSTWINPDHVGAGASQTIMSWQTEGQYTNSWILGEYQGKLYFQHGTSDGAGREPTFGELKAGEWQHVAVTAEGDVLKFFINGVKVGEELVSGRKVDLVSKPLVIGDKDANTRRPYYGALDKLQVYNETLTEEEIKAQFEYNLNPFSVTAENGRVVLQFDKDFQTVPEKEDFKVTMFNALIDPIAWKNIEITTISVDEAQKQVVLEFDPVSAVGEDQTIKLNILCNRMAREAQYVVGKIDDNNPPTASNVKVTGVPDAKKTLTVSYEYSDGDSEKEGKSKIEWWISPKDQKDGTYTKLEGIRTADIRLISYYEGRYLKASVTPMNENYAAGETVMSDPVGPVVNKGNENSQWFRDAKYGIMHHFLHDYISIAAANEEEKLKADESWDAYIDSFDVDAYVQDVLETGAEFVILTIGQHDGFFNAHNPVYDKYAGVAEGERTPASNKRDLPMEIAEALEPYGIKMMFYAVGCPPFRAHKNFGPNFDAGTNPHDGDYGITDAFGQTRNSDTPPSQETLKKWQEVLRYWSEHYGEHLAGWWIDGMWTSQNSLADGTYEINPDLSVNPNANPNAAYAPIREYNWHTWVDALTAGNNDRLLSLSLGGRDDINVPYEDFVGGEAHPNRNFNSVAPRNPALSQIDGWASKEMGIQWFFMSSMGVPVSFYSYWGQKGTGVDTDQVVGWFKNNAEKNAVLVSDSKVNRYGRIDPDQMEQWKKVKSVVRDGAYLDPMETYNDHWYFTKFYDQGNKDNTDWVYVSWDDKYYHSDYTYTLNDGSYFEFEFAGTGVEFYTEKGPQMGEVDIYVDGEYRETISLNHTTSLYQQKVYDISGLEAGLHTIKGVKKNGQRLVVDYFKVLGEVNRNELIAFIEDVTCVTEIGTAPVLPETVTVVYEDGKERQLPVTWEEIAEELYMSAGTFEVLGTVDGTDKKVKCTVTVKESGGEEEPDPEEPNPEEPSPEEPNPEEPNPEEPNPDVDNKVIEAAFENLLETVADAEEGTTIQTKATLEDILLAEVQQAIAGKDITLEITLENGITWVINGKDLSMERNEDIWLNILYGDVSIGTIPASVIDGVKDAISYQVAVLKHSGEFHGKVTLRFPVGQTAMGKYTNLFYYNEAGGKLEYVKSCLVDKDGIAAFELTHASQYVLYISEKEMNQNSIVGDSAPLPGTPGNNGGTKPSNPKTGDEESPMAGFVLAVAAFGMAAALLINRKKFLRS